MLDNTQESGVPVFIPANFTETLFRKEAAFGAGLNLLSCLLEGVGEVLRSAGWCGEKV
jgi:hypothetical protein